MKVTFGQFVLRSFVYVVLMNAAMFVLPAIFDMDYDPNFINNLVVPILCAAASFYGEERRRNRLAMKNK